jgi:hypothetical protein
MKSKTEVIRKQEEWADQHKVKRNAIYRKYTEDIEGNLFGNTLSDNAKTEFENADGSELKDGKYPAKIKALYSSSALAYNVFEYWRKREKTGLTKALGIQNEINKLELEKVLSTGISKPNIDVFLTLNNDTSISIESKFCEWMDSIKDKKFKDQYFIENNKKLNRWADSGLPNCQKIADKIQCGDLIFIRLDATQLLKHALGIANCLSKGSQLLYIYNDLEDKNSRIVNEHRKEISKFEDLIGSELDFKTRTYQELFKKFEKSSSEIDSHYLEYLQSRYFQTSNLR